jgi:hypothetical protein
MKLEIEFLEKESKKLAKEVVKHVRKEIGLDND